MAGTRIHFVLSTHWDREWRLPFQKFRFHLVRLLDHVIAGLADGRLRGPFVTDGQSVLLQDYLEIRPGQAGVVAELLKRRRLVAGPWYVMPDEFTVSGEALIRNLQLGREIVRRYGGEPSDAGYVPDMFGHTGQLPQILDGFGILGVLLWRGLNTIGHRNLIWEGVDGTRLPCHRFGAVGYGTYAHQVRRAAPGQPQPDHGELCAGLEQFIEQERLATDISAILVHDGCDHQDWDEVAYAAVTEHMDSGAEPDLVHTDFDEYLRVFRDEMDRVTKVVCGELREPGRHPVAVDQQWLIPGVLSSRVRLKQANAQCQTLLCQWAEPFDGFLARLSGQEQAAPFLERAWLWLLENHAHDSIDACSIDQVHRDMDHRFDQARLIAEQVRDESLAALAAAATVGDGGAPDPSAVTVCVFNPMPVPWSGLREVEIETPVAWPCFQEFFGFEPKPALRVFGPGGEEIPYQRIGQRLGLTRQRQRPTRFVEAYQVHLTRVVLPLEIPAMGFTTLTVRATPATDESEQRGIGGAVAQGVLPTRHPSVPGLVTGPARIANAFLAVEVHARGEVTLTDLRTGRVYPDLFVFEDSADIGDGWYHGQAVNDVSVRSRGVDQVSVTGNGPFQATLGLHHVLEVPARFEFAPGMTRSPNTVALRIETQITLRADQEFVEVRTRLENMAADHRVRVLFPTTVTQAQTYAADAAFDVVERPIPLRTDNHRYRELEVETRPQQSWTAVFDPDHGVAVVCDGSLLETAVLDLPGRVLALTLFRGTRRTVMTEGEPDGQQSGALEFRYRVLPLDGPPDPVRMARTAQDLAAGIRSVSLQDEDRVIHSRPGIKLPQSHGFLRVEGDAVLSACHGTADGGLLVRVYNPSDSRVECRLVPAPELGLDRGRVVNFEQRPCGDTELLVDGQLTLPLGAKKIVTVLLTDAAQDDSGVGERA